MPLRNRFKVYLTNFKIYTPRGFSDFQSAFESGKLTGFSFSIWEYDDASQTWKIIGEAAAPDFHWKDVNEADDRRSR